MAKTIGRNSTKQVAALRARVTGIRLYTLDNQFCGESLGLDRLPAVLDNWWQTSGTRLTVDGDEAVIHHHMRHWVKLSLSSEAQS